MCKKVLCVVVGLACALAVTTGAARAADGKPTVIVFTIQNVGFGVGSATCPGFFVSFDMGSPGGGLLGSGESCVTDGGTCAPVPGCRDTVQAIFTLDFGRGTLTAPVALEELWLTETTVLQLTHGKVISATGDFAGETGAIACFGTLEITTLTPKESCVVRVN